MAYGNYSSWKTWHSYLRVSVSEALWNLSDWNICNNAALVDAKSRKQLRGVNAPRVWIGFTPDAGKVIVVLPFPAGRLDRSRLASLPMSRTFYRQLDTKTNAKQDDTIATSKLAIDPLLVQCSQGYCTISIRRVTRKAAINHWWELERTSKING